MGTTGGVAKVFLTNSCEMNNDLLPTHFSTLIN